MQAKIKTSKKIAYKKQASVEEVNETGLSNEQIAKKLGVSRSTIWHRLKNEFERARK